jgi:hypothetical protein
VLERRKEVVDVGARGLRAHPLHAFERTAALADVDEARAPFPVASVENEDFGAGAEPQDGQELVRLLGIAGRALSGGKRSLEKQAVRGAFAG